MSHELLYTSAPKGLRPGSRGFCTVISTQGIPAPLTTALESLSAYRQVFPLGDPNADDNPVVWSHVKLNAAGKSYGVLSRVSDYGLDYSERTNKLAHHVALEAREYTPGGPAWNLGQPGLMEIAWDGEPRLIPVGRQLRRDSPPPAVCATWRALTGDAGWAGVLAEAFLANPERQVYIVFRPDMDLLPLLIEAIALLPPERRWDVTFSTYFTSLPPGIVCNWRCVLVDSPEADQSRRLVQALRINLCETLPVATGGAIVEAARTGRAPGSLSPILQPQGRTPKQQGRENDLANELELQPVDDTESSNSTIAGGMVFAEFGTSAKGGGYGVRSSPPLPTGMPPPPPGANRRKLEDLYAEESLRRRRWLPVKIVAAVVTVVVSLGTGLWLGSGRPRSFQELRAGRHDDALLKEGDHSVAEHPKLPARDLIQPVAGDPENAKDVAVTVDHQREPEPPDEGPHHEDVTPIAKDAGDSRPVIPTEVVPTYDDRPLETEEGGPTDFKIYRLSADDGKSLEVPVGGKDAAWDLLLPDGIKGKGFDAKGNKGDAIELLKPGPFGAPDTPVFIVEGAEKPDRFLFKFAKREDPAWRMINWCVLTVTESNAPIKLFILQDASLDWQQTKFQKSVFKQELPFVTESDYIPAVYIKSVTIKLPDNEDAFSFLLEAASSAPPSTMTLVCPELQVFVRRTLELEDADKIPLSLDFKLAGVRRLVQLRISWDKSLDDSIRKRFDARVDKINNESNDPLMLPGNLPQLSKKVAGETMKVGSKELKGLSDTIAMHLERLRKDSQPSQDTKVKITSLERHRKTVNDFDDTGARYRKFKDHLANAQIYDAQFFYKQPIPKRESPVKIDLHFSKIGK